MEDFKDVMLSEPPQRYAGAAPSHVTSNALSLESYKGILLCDRPADNRALKSASQPAPFLPPGNTDLDRGNGNLGLPPSLETRSRHSTLRAGRGDTQNRAKNTALSRHRKWLQTFATEIKKLKQQESDAAIRQSVRDASLREKEARKRRGQSGAETSVDQLAENDGPTEVDKKPIESQPHSNAKKGKKKPKWAMTEEEADDAEFDEARDLVDFAAELDYDGFIKDFEVQEALAIMRDRVREIAAEKGIDIDAERARRMADDTASVASTSTTGMPRKSRKEEPAKRREEPSTEERPGWDDSTSTTIRKALQGDALKLAERVLQSSDALRQVHSKMSMAKLLEDVAMEVNAGKAQRQVPLPTEAVLIAPKIATVAAEATGDHGGSTQQPQKRVLTEMRHSKSQAQNLPYLYRCPSI